MSGALALRNDQPWWDEQQLAALDQMGLADASNGDRAVFLHVCQRSGLDPFARQIHMIGRWDAKAQRLRYTIQTGIDGLRLIAQRSGAYRGRLGPWWCGADGRWSDVWLDDGPPAAARVGVARTDYDEPVYAVVLWREYVQVGKDGAPVALWAGKPAHMLAKVAEAAALRAAFPQDMSGLYTEDEMPGPPARPAAAAQDLVVEMSGPEQWNAIARAFADGGMDRMDPGLKREVIADLLGLDAVANLRDLTREQAERAAAEILSAYTPPGEQPAQPEQEEVESDDR